MHAAWGSKQIKADQIILSLSVKLLQINIVMKCVINAAIFSPQEVITEAIKFWVYLGYLIKKSVESWYLEEMCFWEIKCRKLMV